MVQSERLSAHRVLLVDDDDSIRTLMRTGLGSMGFNVVAAATVTEAVRRITTESFDVLVSDLHMPNPGDGFTVVSAMRHLQPHALTLLVSGYPDVKAAMAAIMQEADEIILKPFAVVRLAELIREKVLNRRPAAQLAKERVGLVLQKCVAGIVERG